MVLLLREDGSLWRKCKGGCSKLIPASSNFCSKCLKTEKAKIRREIKALQQKLKDIK